MPTHDTENLDAFRGLMFASLLGIGCWSWIYIITKAVGVCRNL